MIKLENVIVDKAYENARRYEGLRVRLCKLADVDLTDIIFDKIDDVAKTYPFAGVTVLCWAEDLYQGRMFTAMDEQIGRKSLAWIYSNIEQVADDVLRYGGYLGERTKE